MLHSFLICRILMYSNLKHGNMKCQNNLKACIRLIPYPGAMQMLSILITFVYEPAMTFVIMMTQRNKFLKPKSFDFNNKLCIVNNGSLMK